MRRGQAAETMDRIFETVAIGRQIVVKTKPPVSENQTPRF
jgi:hypothetical protein